MHVFVRLSRDISLGVVCVLTAMWVSPQTLAKANETACTLCFYGPDNIVFDAAGNAYITDNDHKSHFRVLKVSAKGTRIAEWRVFRAVPGRSSGPEGIAIDSFGNIFVTDGGALGVLKFSPTGKLLMSIGSKHPWFHDLGHIAVDSAGYVYVAEGEANRIQKFSSDGKRVAVWRRSEGNGSDQWNTPETIAVRSDGTLVVEDAGNHRIVVISTRTGQTQFVFGGRGEGPGQFVEDEGLGVDHEGNIYVSDWTLHRVQKFDPHGKLLSTISNSCDQALFSQNGPAGVTFDADGNLYTIDGYGIAGRMSVVKLSQQGKLLARWR
jgi:DNA-binding beta-propeller fold protein YncE